MLGGRFGILWRCSGTGGRTKGVVVTVAAGYFRCRAVPLEGEAQLGGHLRAEGDLLGTGGWINVIVYMFSIGFSLMFKLL